MKKHILYIALATTAMAFNACKKYVDVPPPQDQLPAEAAFTNDKTATATMVGLYSSMNGYNYSFGNVLSTFMPAMSADEFYSAFTSFDAFKNNSLTPDNSYVSSLWAQPYADIYQANAIIEGVSASTSLSANVKSQLSGEAKFMRAFCYFYLVNYFGDVPLILNTDAKTNTNLPRTPMADVYTAIKKDLTDAVSEMQDNYQTSERTRPNKAAAAALLARVYLYTNDWASAEATATSVINNSKYKLLTDLTTVFSKTSQEAIWQIASVNTVTGAGGMNTWEGYNIVPASATARGYYNLFQQMVDAFEPGDQRKANWTKTYTTAGTTYYYPYKYRYRLQNPVAEYEMVLRFAEQYLIRAEARANLGKLTDATADLDTLRKRAGLNMLDSDLTKDELLLAIEQERRVELFAEWGHRWFDLKRTGRADAVLSPMKPAWKPTSVLYPIPSSALRTNVNLTPNPGYN